ncbi:MAG: hypothetical protein JW839_05255 [Candidatus Lokiarchaeota archaeon]|nr:hypothetical protein [Candidatus Lokiarchaeota archaeon]
MGKKMTRAGMELRRAIRADLDADPAVDHLAIRRKYSVGEGIVESVMSKTLAEWEVAIAATPDETTSREEDASARTGRGSDDQPASTIGDGGGGGIPASLPMPGIEQGFVKFTRKPAKMGQDFIFWVPRVYVKNGLVDPKVEYDVFLRKKS